MVSGDVWFRLRYQSSSTRRPLPCCVLEFDFGLCFGDFGFRQSVSVGTVYGGGEGVGLLSSCVFMLQFELMSSLCTWYSILVEKVVFGVAAAVMVMVVVFWFQLVC